MHQQNCNRARAAGIGAAFFAAAFLAFAAPLAAQIQPKTTPPSLTPPPPGAPQSAPAPSATQAPPAPPATPESLAKGKAIILAAAKASGGDAINSVKSVEVHVAGHADTPGGLMNLTLKLVVIFPDHFRTDAELPIGTVTQGFDGKDGWVMTPSGLIALPEEFIPEVQRGIALTGGWGLYKQAMNGKVEAQYLDDEDHDGKKANVVQWTGPSGPIKLYFDASTHFLIGAHFRAISTQGTVESDQHWSDFREVQGVMYPYANEVDHDGQKFTETTVSDVKINTNPDLSLFARPPEPKPAN